MRSSNKEDSISSDADLTNEEKHSWLCILRIDSTSLDNKFDGTVSTHIPQNEFGIRSEGAETEKRMQPGCGMRHGQIDRHARGQ